MRRVFYNPPKGTPPLEFESGGLKFFMPPDQYWKRVPEEYVVGQVWNDLLQQPLIDPKTRKPKEIRQVKKVWVPDEEKNELMTAGHIGKPKNYLDLTESDYRHIYNSTSELKQYLVTETQLEAEHNRSMDRLKDEFAEKEARLLREHEARLRKKRLELEAKERALENGKEEKPYPDDDAPPAIARPELKVKGGK